MEIRSATASFVSRGRSVIKRMKAERTKQMLFDDSPVAKAQTVSCPEGKAGDSETVVTGEIACVSRVLTIRQPGGQS